MKLNDLEIYKLSREIGAIVWGNYCNLRYDEKRIFGDQFVRAVDSIGANIAEGFGRFHFNDKNKFNYNARGSLIESIHWLEIMRERDTISKEIFSSLEQKFIELHKRLNSYISTTKQKGLS